MSAERAVQGTSVGPKAFFGFGHNPDFDAGLSAFETGRIEEAVNRFQVCLASDPDPSTRERAKSYLAGCLTRLAKDQMARECWEEAFDLLEDATLYRPMFADVRILRSAVLDKLNRQEDRAFEIRFALDFNPKFAHAVFHDGILKCESGNIEQGLERIEESIRLNPRLQTEECLQAVARIRLGEIDTGVQILKSVKPEPECDSARIVEAANYFAHNGHWAEAEDAYRQAIEITPRYADLHCKHGRVLIELGRFEEAIARLRESVDINPRYADGYAFLGVALMHAGYAPQAEDAFRAALKVDPGHVVALRETQTT